MTTSQAPLRQQPMHATANGLALAAMPVFALMSGLCATAAPPLAMCSATSSWLPVNDMAWMYLLMALFHLPPWLRSAHHRVTASRAAQPR